jgi:hypothetical protein
LEIDTQGDQHRGYHRHKPVITEPVRKIRG